MGNRHSVNTDSIEMRYLRVPKTGSSEIFKHVTGNGRVRRLSKCSEIGHIDSITQDHTYPTVAVARDVCDRFRSVFAHLKYVNDAPITRGVDNVNDFARIMVDRYGEYADDPSAMAKQMQKQKSGPSWVLPVPLAAYVNDETLMIPYSTKAPDVILELCGDEGGYVNHNVQTSQQYRDNITHQHIVPLDDDACAMIRRDLYPIDDVFVKKASSSESVRRLNALINHPANHPIDNRLNALTRRHPNANKNPSQLLPSRPPSDTCTHDLFRNPKTGSTALYNAIQLDDNLASHVCATSWKHKKPRQNHPKPIISTLREPTERFLSQVRYGSNRANQGAPNLEHIDLQDTKDLMRVKRSHQELKQTDFVLHRPDDLVLCIGDGMPTLHEQLRTVFDDENIESIPFENVNRHNSHVTPQMLSEATALKLRDHLREEYETWNQYCAPQHQNLNHESN